MFSSTARVNLLFATYAAAFICVLHQFSSEAKAEQNTVFEDCASSCGNIHNITYPFRLNTDPKHCGIKKYELSCENNVAILYLKRPKNRVIAFRVEAINYNNITIRLSDLNVHLDNCALPVANRLANDSLRNHLDYTEFEPEDAWSSYIFSKYLNYTSVSSLYWSLIFASCPYPMTESSFQVYKSPCNLTRHWYVQLVYLNDDDYYYMFHTKSSCRVEAKTMTSLTPLKAKNISYVDVKNRIAYGFELSWQKACCISEVSRKYNCSIDTFFCPANFTTDQRNRQSVTTGFEILFFFLDSIKITKFFSSLLEALNKAWDVQYDKDDYHRLTIFGIILHSIVAALAILMLCRLGLCFLGCICVILFLIYKWRRRHLFAYDNVEEFLQSHQNYLIPVRYTYSEIKKITKNFKEKLGEGGFGSVYKAKLRSGRFAAIKMLDKSKTDGQDFINEVATIGRIHHVNVVQLIGFCVEGSKRVLVYEFMDNGSLDKHIFYKEGGLSMSNKMIFDISLGVAHGIEYLHQGCDMQILHFDIKPYNILLDEKFTPKISDFGLAKLHPINHSVVSLTAARGTMGYIAPEFFYKNI